MLIIEAYSHTDTTVQHVHDVKCFKTCQGRNIKERLTVLYNQMKIQAKEPL